MNRNDEYLNLIEKLDNDSKKINNLYKKANKKLIKKRVITAVTTTLSTVASLLIIFTILVNNIHSFAYACGEFPVLKELAKFVAKSPSLSAAVEHQYVQPIEISKTQDDITATIEYVIVDQKQVNIFYSLKSDKYKALQAFPEVFDKNKESLECGLMYGDHNEKNSLKKITIDFIDKNVPNYIFLKLKVNDVGEYTKTEVVSDNIDNENLSDYTEIADNPEILTEFELDINLDPNYTAQGQVISLNKKLEVDGQTLIITTVDIYPTHIRVNLDAPEENTKWLKSLNIRIENEKGNKFEKISNGISATGSTDSPMMASHRLESTFFSKSKELTLFIDSITWLDKDKEKIKINLENMEHDTLPENVELYNIKKYGNGYKVEFIVTSDVKNHLFNCFGNFYYDVTGKEYFMNSTSSMWSLNDENGNEILEENQFVETLYLTGYNEDIVYLQSLRTNTYKLEKPIEIKIK